MNMCSLCKIRKKKYRESVNEVNRSVCIIDVCACVCAEMIMILETSVCCKHLKNDFIYQSLNKKKRKMKKKIYSLCIYLHEL